MGGSEVLAMPLNRSHNDNQPPSRDITWAIRRLTLGKAGSEAVLGSLPQGSHLRQGQVDDLEQHPLCLRVWSGPI